MTTVGFGDICSQKGHEFILTIIWMMVGTITYGIIVGNAINLISDADLGMAEYNGKMHTLDHLSKRNFFPSSLSLRV